jgi:glycosyltransferase involved in cell wall biosynthesis
LQLVIVGLDECRYHGRDQQNDLRALLHHRPLLQSRLHFPGRVGNLIDWYLRSQIFVLSSRYEGFPNVLLEAMAAGCCCVAADCPQGPSDLLVSDVNGILIPPTSNDQQWVEMLQRLLNEPAERARLGEAAKAVRECYAPKTLAITLLKELASIDCKPRVEKLS